MTFLAAEKQAHPVDLNNAHVVPVDVKEECTERAHVDDTQAVCLSWLERQARIFIESGQVASVRREVY